MSDENQVEEKTDMPTDEQVEKATTPEGGEEGEE